MKQGRSTLCACAMLAVLAIAAPALAAAPSKSGGRAARSPQARNTLHQFSGTVTAIDKTGLTVEKRGKNPRSMVFVKDAEMHTTGDVEKDARVTVWYRDEDGHPTAHRVVVKQGAGRAARATKVASGS